MAGLGSAQLIRNRGDIMSLLLEGKEADLQAKLSRVNQNHANTTVPKAASALGVEPALIKAILAVETGGRPIKVGENISRLFMIRRHFTPKYKKKHPDRELPAWSTKPFTNKQSIFNQALSLSPYLAYTCS